MLTFLEYFTNRPFNDISDKAKGLLRVVIFFLPVLIYTSVLVSNSIDVPFYDDYDVILSFLNQFRSTQGFSDSLALLLKKESDHIPFFPRIAFWADAVLNGHLNFIHIIYAANACLAGILILLYRSCADIRENKLKLFLPVPFLLFQIQYWEVTTWAVTAMIFLPAIFFSLLSFFLLGRQKPFHLPAACAVGVIAAFSAGNGFFIFPSGFAMLLLQRRMKELLVWTFFSFFFVVSYLALYTVQGNDVFGSIISPLMHHPLLLATFFSAAAGSAAGLGINIFSVVAGFSILLWFFFITYRNYYNRNPIIYAFMVFLLMTAMAVALKRSSYGIDLILFTSRYRLASILLLVVVYISILELLPDDTGKIRFSKYFLIFSVILFVLSYLLYLPFLKGRYHEVATTDNGLLHNNQPAAYNIIQYAELNDIYKLPAGYLKQIDPHFRRSAETKFINFSTRFNQVNRSDTTLTLRFNIPEGNIYNTNIHILFQKPEVIYLFNSGLTPTTVRKVLHNVNPDIFKSDICIMKRQSNLQNSKREGLNGGR